MYIEGIEWGEFLFIFWDLAHPEVLEIYISAANVRYPVGCGNIDMFGDPRSTGNTCKKALKGLTLNHVTIASSFKAYSG